MDYEAKFTGKPREMSHASCHTFLNLHQNSEHVDLVISRAGRSQENRIFGLLKNYIKIAFYPNQKFFPRSSLREI